MDEGWIEDWQEKRREGQKDGAEVDRGTDEKPST